MSFICLCICLETYSARKRTTFHIEFRRNLAVLCSESYEKEKNIQNANLLYVYRSKWYSGMNSNDFNKFELFFEYMHKY